MNEVLVNFEKTRKKLKECCLADKEQAKQEYIEASIKLIEQHSIEETFTSEQKELFRNCLYISLS